MTRWRVSFELAQPAFAELRQDRNSEAKKEIE